MRMRLPSARAMLLLREVDLMQLPVLDTHRSPSAAFDARVAQTHARGLRREATTTLQINLGRRCNQACLHCHVEAGPNRTESMSDTTFDRVLMLLRRSLDIRTVDITGGAPELHPRFRELVREARALGREVIDRCNLTILEEPGMEDLADFLAHERVEIVASLPCYSESNVDKQRGRGVFDASIRGLLRLNGLGYGIAGSGLALSLVYNPGGAFLPPPQAVLEAKYRSELREKFGVAFTRLFTITNMPIRRFDHALRRDGDLDRYENLLLESYNPATVDGLMCRSLVSIAWDGLVHDCDFNQMLDIPCGALEGTGKRTVFDLEDFGALEHARVATGSHCFACTAGAGSSCGGALSP